MRVSNPRVMAYLKLYMPFKCSMLSRLGPHFQIDIWETDRSKNLHNQESQVIKFGDFPSSGGNSPATNENLLG